MCKDARRIARKNMVDNLGVLKRENAGIEKWENPPITPSSLSTVVIVKEKKPTHPPGGSEIKMKRMKIG
jgi:hypothetical protein